MKKLRSLYLKFYQAHVNAGDQFSLALAQRYFSAKIMPCERRPLMAPNLILVGSYLITADAYSHICGAGFMASEQCRSKLSTAPKSIHCVRGPLTAELLEKQGISCPAVYADPGILAPELYPQRGQVCTRIGLVPHFLDANLPWVESCQQKEVTVIDPLLPLGSYFAKIQQCEVILSTSLHGIIFAHAYGKPALWIELSDKVIGDGFKFYDYYASLGTPPEKVSRIRVDVDTDPYQLAELATTGEQSKLLAPLKEAMAETLQQLRRDQRLMNFRTFFLPLNAYNRYRIEKKLKRYYNTIRKS